MFKKILVPRRGALAVRMVRDRREAPPATGGSPTPEPAGDLARLRDLAVAAAVLYAHQRASRNLTTPPTSLSGWSRKGRQVTAWEYGGLKHVQTGCDG